MSESSYAWITCNFKGLGKSGKGRKEVDTDDINSLSDIFVRRVASRHNKNVTFGLVGEMGSGKSMTLLALAQKCGEKLATILGGEAEDYFNFGNVAVISGMADLLQNLKPHNVYILDDTGVEWDARRFQSTDNTDLNHILQTCRTSNNIILFSVPDTFLVDKTPRSISAYWGEVSESFHGHGVTFLKVFRMRRQFREGRTFYYYPTKGKSKIMRFMAKLPSEDVRQQYEQVRNQAAIDIQKTTALSPAERKEKGPSFNDRHWQKNIEEYGQPILELKEQGLSSYKVAQKLGIGKSTVEGIAGRMKCPFR